MNNLGPLDGRSPIWSLLELIKASKEGPYTELRGGRSVYAPARPLYGSIGTSRLRAAWEVLRGRADAFIWPEDMTHG